MNAHAKVELVLDAKAQLGEGPLWHGHRKTLFWVDIFQRELHEFNPSTGKDRVIKLSQFISCVVPRRKGGLMLGLRRGLAHFNLRTNQVKMICQPDRAKPGNRFNDGKCDPAGRFWAGTMAVNEAPKRGSLFCLSPDYSCRRVLTGITVSNGLAWSRDAKTMFYVDSTRPRIFAFDYDCETAGVRRQRMLCRIPKRDGVPDGICLDADDNLWVAHWGGSRVTKWNIKNGKLLRTIRLPVSHPTSCAFGGEKLDQLFITSARIPLSCQQLQREPLAGGIFMIRPGSIGLPACEFAG